MIEKRYHQRGRDYNSYIRKNRHNAASSAVPIVTFPFIERETFQSILAQSAAPFVSKRNSNIHDAGPHVVTSTNNILKKQCIM
jgi:hypothetical protein